MIRRGFLAVDPSLLAWVLSETPQPTRMSALGDARHYQGTEELPFLRIAAGLTEEKSPPTRVRWWANVLRAGAEYKKHSHGGKWAFVYHLTEGAAVHFDGQGSFAATPGQILVFSARLRHWTDKVSGDAPRVSVAGNMHF